MTKDRYIDELLFFSDVMKRAKENVVVPIDLVALIRTCKDALDLKAKNNIHSKVLRGEHGYYIETITNIMDTLPIATEYIYYETLQFSKYGFQKWLPKNSLVDAYRRLKK